MKINEVKVGQTATLDQVEVTEAGEVREFEKFGRRSRVCDVTIKDDTGEMQLTLWNDEIDEVTVGDKLKLTDGWVKEWKDKMQITKGRSGKIEKLE